MNNHSLTPGQKWEAEAPSNLALIKYAGKKDQSNLPLNSSLSYTLEHLVTKVRITSISPAKGSAKEEEGVGDRWRALKEKDFLPLTLSPLAVKRFLDFFGWLKKVFRVSGVYLVESANNFPASAGCASSASSFCALTKATYKMALSVSADPESAQSFTASHLSALSRHGSGSSCRSFFRPWALWEGEGARAVDLPFSFLRHQLVCVGTEQKKVSSSKAHTQIVKSPAFKGRALRAKDRLRALLLALNTQDWKACFKITWDEFQDLHSLYESAGIVYRTKESRSALSAVKAFWDKEGDGPLVTMDAGSAVHLLYRPDQNRTAQKLSALLNETQSK